MITAADILIKLSAAGAGEVQQSLAQAGQGVEGFRAKASKLGGILTATLTAPLLGLGVAAFNASSDLSEAANQVTTVFGPAGAAVSQFAAEADSALGMSKRQALEWGGAFGTIFTQAAGQSQEAAAGLSTDLLGLASDLASFNNMTVDQALTALRSGLTGETEPLKAFKIFLTDAEVQAKAMEMGLAGANGEISEQSKVLARNALMYEKAGVQVGDYARTSDGAANQQRFLKAQFENVAATMGTKLLPIGIQLLTWASALLGRLTSLPSGLQTVVLGFAALLAAAGPLVTAVGAMAGVFGVIGAALAAVVSPVGLVVVALGALGYLAFTQNWFGFADGVHRVAEAFGQLADFLALAWDSSTPLSSFVDRLPGPLQEAGMGVALVVDALGDLAAIFKQGGLDAVMEALPEKLAQAGEGFKQLGEAILQGLLGLDWGAILSAAGGALVSAGSQLLGGLLAGAQAYWPAVSTWLLTLGSLAVDAMGPLGAWLLAKGGELLQGFADGLNDKWPTITAWLGSVGDWALTAAGDLLAYLAPKGVELLQGLANGLVQQWPTITAWLGSAGDWLVTAAGDMLGLLAPKGVELLQGLANGLVQQWPTVTAWLGSVGGWLLTAAGDLLATLAPKGVELLQGLVNGLVQQWPAVTTWLGSVGGWLLTAAGDMLSTLAPKGVELLQGLANGLVQQWPTVTAWLGSVAGWALTAAGDMLATLAPKGVELLQGLVTGLVQQWPSVVTWIGSVAGWIVTAIGSLLATLAPKGIELLQGMLNGLNEKWPTVATWAGSMGGWVATAVGNLISTLAQDGRDLIQGLMNGWEERSQTLGSWASHLGGWVAGQVGDLAGVLWNSGWSLIDGIYKGAIARWNDFTQWLGGLDPRDYIKFGSDLFSLTSASPSRPVSAGSEAPRFGAGGPGTSSGGTLAGGGSIHIEHLHVNLTELRELLQLSRELGPAGRELTFGLEGI